MPEYLEVPEIIKKYRLREPSEEWSLPSFEELLRDVKFVMSVPEFHDVNIERWKKKECGDYRPFEEALKEIWPACLNSAVKECRLTLIHTAFVKPSSDKKDITTIVLWEDGH